jgi:hypothetical protein
MEFTPEEQLLALQNITRMTGALHEAQAMHLKAWPLVACPHAKSCKFSCDPDKKVIEFDLVLKWSSWFMGGVGAPSDLKQRLEGLGQSVQWLLGTDWTVVVKSGNNILSETGPDFSRPAITSKRVE